MNARMQSTPRVDGYVSQEMTLKIFLYSLFVFLSVFCEIYARVTKRGVQDVRAGHD